MRNKIFYGTLIILFVVIQSWFTFTIFRYPYLGINLEKSQGQWIVSSLDDASGSHQLDIKLGDVITSVDGRSPDDHMAVARWWVIEQADYFEVSRDGDTF